MGKLLSRRLAGPDDPMFKEGLTSYSPHWGRKYLKSKTDSPATTAGPQTNLPESGKPTPTSREPRK